MTKQLVLANYDVKGGNCRLAFDDRTTLVLTPRTERMKDGDGAHYDLILGLGTAVQYSGSKPSAGLVAHKSLGQTGFWSAGPSQADFAARLRFADQLGRTSLVSFMKNGKGSLTEQEWLGWYGRLWETISGEAAILQTLEAGRYPVLQQPPQAVARSI